MNESELTILSLLAEGPLFGHELEQVIEERDLREWLALGFSSIYYLLNKLERQGLLGSELRHDGSGPARKVYALTEAGRGVLQTALVDLLRKPHSLGSGFELGLANLAALAPQQVYHALAQHQTDLSKRLTATREAWARREDGTPPENIRALYTHSLAVMQAELDWLTAFLQDWQTRYRAALATEPRPAIPDDGQPPTVVHKRTDPGKHLQRLKRPPRGE